MMLPSRRPLAGLLCLAGLLTAPWPLPAQLPAEAAARALAQGRPWRATELLRPVVADHARADRPTRLLAARAAAAWGGWGTVSRLLADTAWEDRGHEGTARELLGRAALDRRADEEAVLHLRLAVTRAADDRQQGIRHTLLARAFDRLDLLDSAAFHYAAAARLLPDVADWLALRAAGVMADSAARTVIYDRVRLPAARPRLSWTEATARDRTGDKAGAAALFQRLGAVISALRARRDSATTDSARAGVRRDLVAALTPRLAAADARTAIALLDQEFAPLTPAEQLSVARRAAAIGDLERANQAFAAAREAPGLTNNDRFTWGTVLARLGRHPAAITQFEAIRTGPLAGSAAYQRARSLLARSGAAAALPALRQIPTSWPADTAASAVALYLAGDLLADQGDYAGASASYLQLADTYPTADHAPRALLEVGTLSYALGDRPASLAAFRRVAERYREREEGSAGAWWAGRLEAEAGDTATARERWRALVRRVPQSYYAMAAARRLGEPAWAPGPGSDPPPVSAVLKATLARVALLDSLGFDTEERFELDHLTARADSSVESLLATAEALAASNLASRATTLALRAQGRGSTRDTRLYRLLYPVPEPATFRALVADRGLDPWLVAGLIRQESAFNPLARSIADARGLMQVLPSVGGQLARQMGWTEWDPVLLYQPEVSLSLGTIHLAEMIRRYPDIFRVLAAYNAGPSRVERWNQRPGVQDDPDLFLEQIPYLETRNYLRRVLRNAEFYRALYEN